ncbi:recombinase family protein [Actinoplanes sp. NPDC048988]|uniref:recombinase family protein n=1 Tax=Actinoplanes sp. NPDC048988 TaxID=3363901 RepID=UPI0037184F74
MRVLGVIRLSLETDETTSPERQRSGLTAWAEAHGHVIVGWAEDLTVSGDVHPTERPELGPWLSDNPPVPYDVIAAIKIDRLSRNLLHFVQLIDWAQAHGKYVVAYKDSVDTSTDVGALMAKILAIFAEFERKTIAKRNLDSRAHARKEGKWHGGNVKYGYKAVKQAKGQGWRLVPDPVAKAVIEEIVRRVLGGEPMNAVADDLNARGVPSPLDYAAIRDDKEPKADRKPRRWHYTVIQRMLTSRSILGQAEHNGQVVRDEESGLPIQRAEPLISLDEWKKIQEVLESASRRKTRTSDAGELVGVAFCGEHGLVLHHQDNTRRNKDYRYYRCPNRRKSKGGCDLKPVRAAALEEYASDAFLSLVGDLEVMEKKLIPGEDHTEKLRRTEETMRELEDDREAGLYSTPHGRESFRRMYLSLTAQQEELSALPNRPDRWEDVPTGISFRELWHSLETAKERRDFLVKSGMKVHVYAEPSDPDYPGMPRIPVELGRDMFQRVMDYATRHMAGPDSQLPFAVSADGMITPRAELSPEAFISTGLAEDMSKQAE